MTQSSTHSEAPPTRVLFLDDDRIFGLMVKKFLERKGIEVTLLYEGEEVVDALFQRTHSLVITDVYMEPYNGLQILEKVRKAYPSMPVMMISGYPKPEVLEHPEGPKVEAFLAKPFSVKKLYQTILEILNLDESGLEPLVVPASTPSSSADPPQSAAMPPPSTQPPPASPPTPPRPAVRATPPPSSGSGRSLRVVPGPGTTLRSAAETVPAQQASAATRDILLRLVDELEGRLSSALGYCDLALQRDGLDPGAKDLVQKCRKAIFSGLQSVEDAVAPLKQEMTDD